jgi:L-2-hydroxyglutarate oxidase LhgO
MERVDCIVVGAGVVGLAIARALARSGRETVIVETAKAIGTESSSRNNEVIHAGFLYPPESLKGRLCRKGRDALYTYCNDRGVATKRIGKFVIATTDSEIDALQSFLAYAERNGVHDLAFMDRESARQREPNLDCRGAIFSPSSGIVDSHALMHALLGDAEDAGAVIAYASRVEWIKPRDGTIVIGVAASEAQEYELESRLVINAAGLGAMHLARALLAPRNTPEIFLAKGNFFAFSNKNPFRHLVVPMGETLAQGGAFTIDIGGQGKFGPDLEWVDRVDYSVDAARAPNFLSAIRRFCPAAELGPLQPGYSGIRPRVTRTDAMSDWVINGPEQHGARGLINLFGIDTPGLTACLSIGEHVTAIAEAFEREYESVPHH